MYNRRFLNELAEWLTDGGGMDVLYPFSRALLDATIEHDVVQESNEVGPLIETAVRMERNYRRSFLRSIPGLYPDGRMQAAHVLGAPPKTLRTAPRFSEPRDTQRAAGHTLKWKYTFQNHPKPDLEDLLELLEKFNAHLSEGGEPEDWNEPLGRGYYEVTHPLWMPPRGAPDQIEATKHAQACWTLDATPAGPKARDLMFGLLDDAQIDSVIKRGYFEIIKTTEFEIDKLPASQRLYFKRVRGPDRKYMIFSRRYRIYPAWPNGNVLLTGSVGNGIANFCLHPPTAFPTDDIAVAQKMLIETDEYQFWNDANVTPTNNYWTIDEIARDRHADRREFLSSLDRRGVQPMRPRTIAEARSHAIAQAT